MPLPPEVQRAWRQAANEERAVRSALIVCPDALWSGRGPLTLPVLRMRHLAKLDAIQSPWLGHDNRLGPADVIRAWLIIHDADYATGTSRLRRSRLARQCSRHLLTAAELIAETIEQALRDLPPSPDDSRPGPAHACPAACLIDILAAEYGWSLERILDLPVAAACQFLRCILRRKHEAPLGNPSDRILTEYLDGAQRRDSSN